MKRLINRGAALLASLLFAASLWNFTLSKVATWDVPVPFFSALTVYLVIRFIQERNSYFLLPLLVPVIIIGMNLYEAFRLIFPITAGLLLFPLLVGPNRRFSRLLLLAPLSVSIWIQSAFIDQNFWIRLASSKLVGAFPPTRLLEFGQTLLTKLFTASYDIYLSQSQNGLDHPVIIGLFLVGLVIALVNATSFSGYVLSLWLLLPAAAAWWFEGQWRRASVGMPALYCLAGMPAALLWHYLVNHRHDLEPRGRVGENTRMKVKTSATDQPAAVAAVRTATYGKSHDMDAGVESPPRRFERASIAATAIRGWRQWLPAVVVALLAISNLARFASIQRGRWGGYYQKPEEINAARYAASICSRGETYLFAETHEPLWNFVGLLNGGSGGCFVHGINLLEYSEERSEFMNRVVDSAVLALQKSFFFISTAKVYQEFISRFTSLAEQDPPRAKQLTIPGVTEEYVLFEVENGGRVF